MPEWNYTVENGETSPVIELRPVSEKRAKEQYDRLMEVMPSYIDQGFEIYSMNFEYFGKRLKYYVFIDPETNKAVTRANVFALYTGK